MLRVRSSSNLHMNARVSDNLQAVYVLSPWESIIRMTALLFIFKLRFSSRQYLRETIVCVRQYHDDVIKWKHFPRYWPFVRGIDRSLVNSPHQSPVTRSFDVFFDLAWINIWVNIREAGDLRRHRAHYDVIVMNIS